MKLYLRDLQRHRAMPIDDYSSFSVTRKHAGISTWTLKYSAESRMAASLSAGDGILLEDGDRTFSGPAGGPHRKRNAKENTVELLGYGDDVWLARRWTQPCPPPYTASVHDAQTGLGETVIKHYVRANLGADAVAARQLPGLVVAPDQQRGPQITQQFRFDVLSEALASCALAADDLGWDMGQGVENYDKRAIVFDVARPRDMTKTAKFSIGLRNLAEFEYEIKAPDANYVLVAGAGDGTERVFRERGDSASIAKWGRIEGPLHDRRDSPFLDQLEQSLTEDLAKGKNKIALSFKAVDTKNLVFGRDWGLHDYVTVEVDGAPLTEMVRETTETWEPGKPKDVSVVVSTPDALPPDVPRIFAAQRATALRASQLERTQ
jgi:hypothetical protein